MQMAITKNPYFKVTVFNKYATKQDENAVNWLYSNIFNHHQLN